MGDIFPIECDDLIRYSIRMIKQILKWGNPVQIISKNYLPQEYIERLVEEIKYPGQLLYSTTVTTIQHWKEVEPFTSSPIERLETCMNFHMYNVPTNVLLKPFFVNMTGREIEQIAECLLKYEVDYCTVGILYFNDTIVRKISNNPILKEIINFEK